MTRHISILILAIIASRFSFGQVSYTHDQNGINNRIFDSVRIDRGSAITAPLILLNGFPVDLDTIRNIDSLQKQIGTIFTEGDSAWAAWYFNSSNNHDFVQRLFGYQRNNGIVFIFTKNKIKYLDFRKNKLNILAKESKSLWKLNDKPLTDNDSQMKNIPVNLIKEAQLVKDLPLRNYKTMMMDTFNLFIIKTKN